MIDADAWAEAQLNDLQRLVEIETPTGNKAQADKCALLLAEIGNRLFGSRAQIIQVETDDGPLLLMRFGKSKSRLAFVGHYDTVHEMGALARQPFAVTWEQGRQVISGPGTYDMKAGLITMLYGVAQACRDNPVDENGRDPFDGLLLYLNPDEEEGSRSTRPHMERLVRDGLTAAVVFEGALAGGAFKGGRMGAMWPLVAVKPSRRNTAQSSISTDVSYVEVTVSGQDGHPSDVGNYGSALAEAASRMVTSDAIDGVRSIDLYVPGQKLNRTPGTATFVLECRSDRRSEVEQILRSPIDTPGVSSVSATWRFDRPALHLPNDAGVAQVASDIFNASSARVAGGRRLMIAPTMVLPESDGTLKWVADCRSVTENERVDILNHLRAAPVQAGMRRESPGQWDAGERWFFHGHNFAPYSSALSTQLFKLVQKVKPEAQSVVSAGVSDASHLAGYGIKALLDGAGPEGGGDHGPHERVVGGLAERTELTAAILLPALELAHELWLTKTPALSAPAVG